MLRAAAAGRVEMDQTPHGETSTYAPGVATARTSAQPHRCCRKSATRPREPARFRRHQHV